MEKKQGIGFFEKYLTIWVALCIIFGIAVGYRGRCAGQSSSDVDVSKECK